MLFNGVLGAAGLAIILPMFVPSRWRSRETDTEAEATEYASSLTGPTEAPPPGLPKQPALWSEPAQATPVELPRRSIPPWNNARPPRSGEAR
jgi:hypothetical protein